MSRRRADLLVVLEDGFGKRIPVGEVPRVRRGREGRAIVATPGVGPAIAGAGAVVVEPGDSILLATLGGRVVRLDAACVRRAGRRARGVRVVRLRGGDRVVAITRVPGELERNPAQAAGSTLPTPSLDDPRDV